MIVIHTDYMELGPTPYNEECVPVSDSDYVPAMIAECERYKKLLETLFPKPEGVYGHFKLKRNDHDFGPYYEVVVVYEVDDEKSVDWAFHVESNLPESWEEQ